MSYDPTIGRFIQEDPAGFDSGDPNLYRYVGNSPTNATDPTGMAERRIQIGLPFRANLVYDDTEFTPQEIETVRRAFEEAATRLQVALDRLGDWDETTRRWRVLNDPLIAPVPLPQPIWAEINAHRQWLLEGLRTAVAALRSPSTQIRVSNRPNERHPDRNPMYTVSRRQVVGGEFGGTITCRAHFWETSARWREFWTAHELARLFLRMDDDQLVTPPPLSPRSPFFPGAFGGSGAPPGPLMPRGPLVANPRGPVLVPGVQAWDRWIQWLFERQ